MKEDEANPDEDLVENEALQSSSHGLKNTAIWRLLDGPGATPEVAARTPVANRTAAGRLDFVLQVQSFQEILMECACKGLLCTVCGLIVASVFNCV